MSARPFSRQQQTAFKVDKLDPSRKLLSLIIHRYYPPVNDIFPNGFNQIYTLSACVIIINRAWTQQKAVFYFYWQPRREASINELVSFVISRVGGTEVISLDVRVDDFPSRVAQFSCAREKACRPDGLNRGTSIAPCFIASRNAKHVKKTQCATMRNTVTWKCIVKSSKLCFLFFGNLKDELTLVFMRSIPFMYFFFLYAFFYYEYNKYNEILKRKKKLQKYAKFKVNEDWLKKRLPQRR